MPFRGRCSFLQYMPSKPGKYGLKLFWICDAENAYPLRCLPYLGKEDDNLRDEGLSLGASIAVRLVQPFAGKGRNVTMDNFFTDMNLVEKLEARNTTLVGTVRRNKQFLPPSFKAKKNLPLYGSSFAFSNNTMLASYQGHRNKNVIVLSTMHDTPDVTDGEKKKPDVVLFYNKTKGGVDTMDKLALTYTTKRGTKRWPMVLFYNMLDMSGVAAGVVFKTKKPADVLSGADKRADFLRDIAKSLMKAHIYRRHGTLTQGSQALKLIMENCLSALGLTSQPTSRTGKKRGRCAMCDWRTDKKGTSRCTVCSAYLCKDHMIITCSTCAGK